MTVTSTSMTYYSWLLCAYVTHTTIHVGWNNPSETLKHADFGTITRPMLILGDNYSLDEGVSSSCTCYRLSASVKLSIMCLHKCNVSISNVSNVGTDKVPAALHRYSFTVRNTGQHSQCFRLNSCDVCLACSRGSHVINHFL